MTVAAARALHGVHRPASSASGCPAPRPTSPARPTPPTSCWSTSPAAIGAKPTRCRCRSATACWPRPPTSVVSVPEIFNYWLQPGRIDVGFLGAAQIDRFAQHQHHRDRRRTTDPKVRLPGAGGAPEIAASLRRGDRRRAPQPAHVRRAGRLRHLVGLRRRRRATGERLGLRGDGPERGHHRPRRARARPETCELIADRSCTRASTVEQVREATGWDLAGRRPTCARRRAADRARS